MNGPEDCGRAQGDHPDYPGTMGDWALEGIYTSSSELDCDYGGTAPKQGRACGLGFELAMLLPALLWARRRLRS